MPGWEDGWLDPRGGKSTCLLLLPPLACHIHLQKCALRHRNGWPSGGSGEVWESLEVAGGRAGAPPLQRQEGGWLKRQEGWLAVGLWECSGSRGQLQGSCGSFRPPSKERLRHYSQAGTGHP